MNNTTYSLRAPEALLLPPSDADTLIRLSDGDCALLYLYLLRSGGTLVEKAASEALRMSAERLRLAADRLRAEGLLSSGPKALTPADELPEYTSEELVARSKEDKNWRALLDETQKLMGKALSRPELNTLFGIYDTLGMSVETIILLINYLTERLRKRYGEGRSPTVYAIQQEAYVWARKGILSLDSAMEYLSELDRNEEREKDILEIIQLRDRKPSPSERQYLDNWTAMGFPANVYALAYDRMVSQIGKFNWKYMNSILVSWQQKGLKTVSDIEKGDAKRSDHRSGKSRIGEKADVSWAGDDLSLAEQMFGKKG